MAKKYQVINQKIKDLTEPWCDADKLTCHDLSDVEDFLKGELQSAREVKSKVDKLSQVAEFYDGDIDLLFEPKVYIVNNPKGGNDVLIVASRGDTYVDGTKIHLPVIQFRFSENNGPEFRVGYQNYKDGVVTTKWDEWAPIDAGVRTQLSNLTTKYNSTSSRFCITNNVDSATTTGVHYISSSKDLVFVLPGEESGWTVQYRFTEGNVLYRKTNNTKDWSGSEWKPLLDFQDLDNKVELINKGFKVLSQAPENEFDSLCSPGLYYCLWKEQLILVRNYNMGLGRAQYRVSNDGIEYRITTKQDDDGTYVWGRWSSYNPQQVDITYKELVTLRNRGKLRPGIQYRIIDFVTTVANDPEARSAGHQFDIIVLATEINELAEEAHAAYPHDSDGYFDNCNFAAWKVWYCLDNDAKRFGWADTENGKGVIYRLIDEFGNDLPYDFKNIQFKRYYVGSKEYPVSKPFGDRYLAPAYNSKMFDRGAQFLWLYTFSQKCCMDLPDQQAGEQVYDITVTDSNLVETESAEDYFAPERFKCERVRVEPFRDIDDECATLNNIVCATEYGQTFADITIQSDCKGITFFQEARYINIGHSCFGIIMQSPSSVTIGSNSVRLLFYEKCRDIHVQDGCGDLEFGEKSNKVLVRYNIRNVSIPANSSGFCFDRFGGVRSLDFFKDLADDIRDTRDYFIVDHGGELDDHVDEGVIYFEGTDQLYFIQHEEGGVYEYKFSKIGVQYRTRKDKSPESPWGPWRNVGSIVNIKYAALKELRDNNLLTPGLRYRITDYITTVGDNIYTVGVSSANKPFDLIVLATSGNALSEEAQAVLRAGAEGYFRNSNLAAWKVWYCLDNDESRFTWADPVNGKGVIYRLIDEHNNDCPYDFKNIMFLRYKLQGSSQIEPTRNGDFCIASGYSSVTMRDSVSSASSNVTYSSNKATISYVNQDTYFTKPLYSSLSIKEGDKFLLQCEVSGVADNSNWSFYIFGEQGSLLRLKNGTCCAIITATKAQTVSSITFDDYTRSAQSEPIVISKLSLRKIVGLNGATIAPSESRPCFTFSLPQTDSQGRPVSDGSCDSGVENGFCHEETYSCSNNTIQPAYYYQGGKGIFPKQVLNNIVIFTYDQRYQTGNHLFKGACNISIAPNCTDLTFFEGYNISIAEHCIALFFCWNNDNVTVGWGTQNCVIGVHRASIGHNCMGLTIQNSEYVTIGSNCTGIEVIRNSHTKIGDECNTIRISENSHCNTIALGSSEVTLGRDCCGNSICGHNILLEDMDKQNTVEGNNIRLGVYIDNCTIKNCENIYMAPCAKNVRIYDSAYVNIVGGRSNNDRIVNCLVVPGAQGTANGNKTAVFESQAAVGNLFQIADDRDAATLTTSIAQKIISAFF